MPLPEHALTVTGGCNCRKIVYKIAIPPLNERPLHPNFDLNSGLDPVYQPFIFTDHCNDCREATGSILPAWISGPLEFVSVSLENNPQQSDSSRETSEWMSAQRVLTRENELNKGKLSFYNSSPGRYRTFCTNCGTNLSYWEEQLPSMLDIVLGTVDREYLSTEDVKPERHLWWNLGMPWMKEWIENGDGGRMEKHVDADMNDRFVSSQRKDG